MYHYSHVFSQAGSIWVFHIWGTHVGLCKSRLYCTLCVGIYLTKSTDLVTRSFERCLPAQYMTFCIHPSKMVWPSNTIYVSVCPFSDWTIYDETSRVFHHHQQQQYCSHFFHIHSIQYFYAHQPSKDHPNAYFEPHLENPLWHIGGIAPLMPKIHGLIPQKPTTILEMPRSSSCLYTWRAFRFSFFSYVVNYLFINHWMETCPAAEFTFGVAEVTLSSLIDVLNSLLTRGIMYINICT